MLMRRVSSSGPSAVVRARSPLTTAWESQLQVGEMKDHSRNRSSEPWSFNNGEFESTNRQANWTNEVAVNERVKAQLGVEHLQQRGASTAFDPNFANVLTEFDRNVTSVWGGVNGRTDRQLVQVNVRVDKYSDVGSATTGLVSYGYKLTPEWRAIAQVSNAFRAPSFSDLYYPFFGNPDLKPEESKNLELDFSGRYTAWDWSVNLYRNQIQNLISCQSAFSSCKPDNTDAEIRGVEVALGLETGPLHHDLSFDYTKTEDKNDGDQQLLRRAKQKVSWLTQVQLGQVDLSTELLYVGKRDDKNFSSFPAERVVLSSYTLVNLGASYGVTPALTLGGRIDNLFDAQQRVTDGNGEVPISYQPDFVDPKGRFFEIDFRKRF